MNHWLSTLKKIKDLKDLPNGAKVAIPSDPTNSARALLLLQSAGLVTLKDPTGLTNTPFDVTSNPKNIQITELEAAQIPRSIQDLDAAVINANYALPAGLNPTKDGLFVEKLTLHMQIFFPLTLVMKINQLSKN